MQPTLKLFGLEIDSYTLMMFIGIILSLLVILIKNHYRKEDKASWQDICFLAIFVLFGSLVGARILYFITRLGDVKSFNDIYKFLWSEGGLVFYGGVIGGIMMGLLYLKIYKLPVNTFIELCIPTIPLGHAFGRIGCFLAGCCYGKVTNENHGVHFPFLEENVYVIPVQLYEAIFLFLLFIFLLIINYSFKNKKPYLQSGLYFIIYGLWRFIIEFFRGDEIRGIFLLSTSQWISLLAIALGTYMLVTNLDSIKFFKKKTKETANV